MINLKMYLNLPLLSENSYYGAKMIIFTATTNFYTRDGKSTFSNLNKDQYSHNFPRKH